MLNRSLLTLTLMAFNSYSVANEADPFDLDIQDLLEIKVTVGSSTPESIKDSPSVVSSFSSKKLADIGVRSLSEALSLFTGFIVNRSPEGNFSVRVRGVGDRSNQKILLLLNETPIWMAANGETIIGDLGLVYVERIEVIRGPGSVIFGTNGSAAVIKVVTKKNTEQLVQVTSNGNGVSGVQAFSGLDLGSSSLYLGADIQNYVGEKLEIKDGFGPFDFATNSFPENQDGEIDNETEGYNLFAHYILGDLNVQLHHVMSRHTGFVNGTPLTPIDKFIYSDLADASYSIPTSKGKMKLSAFYNRFYRKMEAKDLFALTFQEGDGSIEFDGNGAKNYRQGAKFTDVRTYDSFNIFWGLEFEERSTGDNLYKDDAGGAVINAEGNGVETTPGYDSVLIYGEGQVEESSAFTQIDWRTGDFRTTVGARYVNNSLFGSKVMPRLNFVWQVDPNNSLKLLHSVGFNSPTFSQNRNVDERGVTIESDVSAETVHSTDFVYIHQQSGYSLRLNGFHMAVKDQITRVQGIFQNGDQSIRRGGEAELDIGSNQWRLFAGLSYLAEGNTVIENDQSAYFFPKLTGNLLLSYNLNPKFSLFSRVQGQSKSSRLASFASLDLGLKYHHSNLNLGFELKNANQETIIHPDIGGWRDVMVSTSESEYRVNIAYKF